MSRPRLIRGLGIAWSVWWGIVCVLLVVLWVRSYYYCDSLEAKGDLQLLQILSNCGSLVISRTDFRDTPQVGRLILKELSQQQTLVSSPARHGPILESNFFGFGWHREVRNG